MPSLQDPITMIPLLLVYKRYGRDCITYCSYIYTSHNAEMMYFHNEKVLHKTGFLKWYKYCALIGWRESRDKITRRDWLIG